MPCCEGTRFCGTRSTCGIEQLGKGHNPSWGCCQLREGTQGSRGARQPWALRHNPVGIDQPIRVSQRDSVPKPGVARHELHWVIIRRNIPYPNWGCDHPQLLPKILPNQVRRGFITALEGPVHADIGRNDHGGVLVGGHPDDDVEHRVGAVVHQGAAVGPWTV